ncbi:ribose-phosphate diphosphokinase [Lacisediminimonas profundi]|uniref:ribose-phosphate diphosphokinase n=1 Tax=Lacisediminimonas profundi TaxID=2603856 RepID=UPI00124B89AB|nr:ribose-phosphate diphosphokinase [Lacisediminimonas profundi]
MQKPTIATAYDQATGPALFALSHGRAYGERVADRLGMDLLPVEEREFEDGEHKSRPLVSVRGRDVYVLQSLHAEFEHSVNDKLCRLLFFIGALKDAAAARVTAVIPYLAYARKDQKSKSRDPVTTRYVAALLESVGTDVVLTIDVHNLAAYQNAFRCRTEHLSAAPLLVAALAPLLTQREVMVLAPDTGAVKRVDRFRQLLSAAIGREAGIGFMEKYRSEGRLGGGQLVGDAEGRDVIVLDDLISTGSTIARAASAASKHGAARVIAAATHGVFQSAASHVLDLPGLERILVCDTVPPLRLDQGAVRHMLMVVDSTQLVAEAIGRMHGGGSLVELNELAWPVPDNSGSGDDDRYKDSQDQVP